MTSIPHIRVTMPTRMRGKLSGSRGARFYITLPGYKDEVEATWLTGASLHVAMDDVNRVDLHAIASIEVQYEDEAMNE